MLYERSKQLLWIAGASSLFESPTDLIEPFFHLPSEHKYAFRNGLVKFARTTLLKSPQSGSGLFRKPRCRRRIAATGSFCSFSSSSLYLSHLLFDPRSHHPFNAVYLPASSTGCPLREHG
jgi:hypothetical protein